MEINKCNGSGCQQRETCWHYIRPIHDNKIKWMHIDLAFGYCLEYLDINWKEGKEGENGSTQVGQQRSDLLRKDI